MFRCENCGRSVGPGEPTYEVIVGRREREYPVRQYRLRGDRKDRLDPGGTGWEIVRAVKRCASCATGGIEEGSERA